MYSDNPKCQNHTCIKNVSQHIETNDLA